MNIQTLKIDELIEYDNNPRNNDKAVEAVAESIRQFGFKVPIVIDKNNVIVAGHTRLKAAKLLGLNELPCLIADDLTEEQIKAFRLADNKVSEIAEWDFTKLEEELAELYSFDMDLFGFDTIPATFSEDTTSEEDIDEIIEEMEEPLAKLGELWQLGDHRLIVGDCTNIETIESLMNGVEADLLLTDPPYNVAVSNSDGLTIKNDDMEDTEFLSFLTSAFISADNVMKKGASFYIWHGETEGLNFRLACKNAKWLIKQNLIWVKNQITIGRQDYQWKHEPCLYGWKEGAGHYFFKNRKQPTIISDDEPNLDFMTNEELKEYIQQLLEPSSIFRIDKPTLNDLHPTMKPIDLIKKQIRNSTKRGGYVLDIFGGSGTTLLAAEELKRVCFTCELDEKYASVIIKRWEEKTGLKANRIL